MILLVRGAAVPAIKLKD